MKKYLSRKWLNSLLYAGIAVFLCEQGKISGLECLACIAVVFGLYKAANVFSAAAKEKTVVIAQEKTPEIIPGAVTDILSSELR